VSATGKEQWPLDDGPGNRRPPSDATGQSVDVAGGWACKMVGSGRVSGAVVDVSTQNADVERDGDAIAADWTQTPDAGDSRPAVGRGRMIGRHLWSFLFPIEAD